VPVAEERELMLDVAISYYLDTKSKVEIASQLGLSRFRVARLLEQARDDGLVRITIMDGVIRGPLSEQLAQHLQLDRAIIVAGAADEAENREALAKTAASLIRRSLHPGGVFGFSWGRTLSKIGEFIEILPASTLVALTGSVGTDIAQSPVEVLRGIAGGSPIRTMTIFAPLLVESASTAEALRRDPAIASVLATYQDLDLAVVSIGSWDPPITQLMDSLSDCDRAELDREGARAELVGIFVRDDGRPVVDADLTKRRIAISAEQLIAVPQVLAVAGGVEKVPAIAAVARSRIINALITDERTARSLLELEPVPPGPRQLPAEASD
jgi:DNA-binding transcriptional regulator LsrR (DeoR family)